MASLPRLLVVLAVAAPLAQAQSSVPRLPLHFLATADGYVARGPGGQVAITPTGLTVAHGPSRARLALSGASPTSRLAAIDPLALRVSSFHGADPRAWRANLPTWARLRQDGVWPGIDAVYYGADGQLEYDFQVAAGADPRRIEVVCQSGWPRLTADGAAVVSTAGLQVRLRAPVAWQEVHGVRRPVAAAWERRGADRLGFRLGWFDRRLPLVIDPVLTYASYVGGSAWDQVTGVARDGAGNLWLCGTTMSPDLGGAGAQPALAGSADLFALKLSATGVPLAVTYLGGSGYDSATEIAVDAAGNVYLLGSTGSADWPLQHPLKTSLGGFGDAVVASLNATGTVLRHSTYWGCSGQDMPGGIAVCPDGGVVVVNTVAAGDALLQHPYDSAFGGSYEAHVAKLAISDAAASVAWATLLGGTGDDFGSCLATNSLNQVVVAGGTSSADYPRVLSAQGALAGASDVFVTTFSADGAQVVQSSLLGGSGGEEAYGLALDPTGAAYAVGFTNSGDFPLVNALPVAQRGTGVERAFAAKLPATGGAFSYATPLGGSSHTYAQAVAVDAFGRACLAGTTQSPDYPTVRPVQSALSGPNDAFVASLSATGDSLSFSTFYGGSGNDSAQGVLVDNQGLVTLVGSTASADLRLVNPQRAVMAGGFEGYLALFDTSDAQPPALALTGLSRSSGGNGATLPIRADGHGFQAGAELRLTAPGQPDVVATGVQVAGDGQSLTAVLDLRGQPVGPRTVTVTNPDGGVATLGTPFLIDAGGLRVTTVTPAVGYALGQQVLQVDGGGFGDGLQVTLVPAAGQTLTPTTVQVSGATRLLATFDLRSVATGVYDLQVTDAGGSRSTLAGAFTIAPGEVTGVNPATAGNIGPTTLTITGSGFRQDARVELQRGDLSVPGADVAVAGDGHSLTARFDLRDQPTGAWAVVVVNPGANGLRLADGLTLYQGVRIDAINPSHVIDAGTTEVTILGAGFPTSTQVTLRQNGQVVYSTWATARRDGRELVLQLVGAPLPVGQYDVVAARPPDQVATVANGLQVVAAPLTYLQHQPTSVAGYGRTTLTIWGLGLSPQMTVRLVRQGQPDVPAVGVVAAEDRATLHASFVLTWTETGTYDLVLTRPDGATVTVPAALTFTPPPANAPPGAVTVSIMVGRIRVGQMVSIPVMCVNRGTRDVRGAICLQGLPAGVDWDLSGLPAAQVGGETLPWRDRCTTSETDGRLTVIVPGLSVAAGQMFHLWFTVRVPVEQTFSLTAQWAGY